MNAASEALLEDYFKSLAKNSGVIHSVSAEEELVVTLNLINYCHRLGYGSSNCKKRYKT